MNETVMSEATRRTLLEQVPAVVFAVEDPPPQRAAPTRRNLLLRLLRVRLVATAEVFLGWIDALRWKNLLRATVQKEEAALVVRRRLRITNQGDWQRDLAEDEYLAGDSDSFDPDDFL